MTPKPHSELVAFVREHVGHREMEPREIDRVKAALDSLEEQYELVKTQRDAYILKSDQLEEQFDAAVEALRDIERAGHTGPNALTREGFYARAALERLGVSNSAKRPS